MAASNIPIPEPPPQLKAIHSYMKVASDIERLDPVVAYWVRLYSTETALKIDRESPECKTFLGAIILWLEQFKKTHKDNETISNQTVGQAHMENFVVALFNKVDTLDREGTANKTTVRMFFMAAVLFEAMEVFGPLTDEVSKRAKYAKFKAAYIQKCLKAGQVPKPGPIEGSDLEESNSVPGESGGGNQPSDILNSTTIKSPDATNADSSFNKDPFILTPSAQPPSLPRMPPSPQPSSKVPKSLGYSDTPSKVPAPNVNPSSGSTIESTKFHALDGTPLNAEDLLKGQKFCKFATSALQYDDIPTAVANLEKALQLLKTGRRVE